MRREFFSRRLSGGFAVDQEGAGARIAAQDTAPRPAPASPAIKFRREIDPASCFSFM